jgi:Holliday junction DNA helicase RuvA
VIALVAGEVAVRRGDHVVVETASGVGYRLAVSAETLKHVPAAGGTVSLHAHLIVRDDALVLHGFHTEEERDLFLMLIGVQGVGPKVAQAVLGAGSPRELVGALAAGDAKRFQAVPGIGKRTAERIIVELREKVAGEIASDADGPRQAGEEDARSLAREGLLNLGYTPPEAEQLLAESDGESPEEIVQSALRRAARAQAA